MGNVILLVRVFIVTRVSFRMIKLLAIIIVLVLKWLPAFVFVGARHVNYIFFRDFKGY